jgi:hypothetical protein
MFKWPDPPEGQIIVRLPFEIYWATSLSVTIILGFGMIIWSVKENPDKWRKAAERISRIVAGKQLTLMAKKIPDDGSHHEEPNQNSPGTMATTKSCNAALTANAQLTLAVAPNEEIVVHNPQTAEPETVSSSDIEAGAVIGINGVNHNARHYRCAVM